MVLLGLALAAAQNGAAGERPSREDPTPRVLQVEMVDVSPTEFAFRPATIHARRGDVIRFVQQGLMPHNVEFKETPAGADLGEAEMGPFLTAAGQSYELVIDERFVAGSYRIVCTPHATLGMTAILEVE